MKNGVCKLLQNGGSNKNVFCGTNEWIPIQIFVNICGGNVWLPVGLNIQLSQIKSKIVLFRK